MEHKMGQRQRWAWLAAAWSILAAACLCGQCWLWVLAGGLGALAWHRYLDRTVAPAGLTYALPRPVLVLTWLWLVWVLAWAVTNMELAFPKTQGSPVLGWVLLALAAWGSRKGSAACAACSGVLCLILAVLYGVILAFAVPDVKWDCLQPTESWEQSFKSLGLCLLPGVLWFLPSSGTRKNSCTALGLLLPGASAVLAAWTAGVLSPQLAALRPVPLYDLAQSITILGVVERIEPLLSAAMTMGLFSLLAMGACACEEIGRSVLHRAGAGTAACLAAALGSWKIPNFQTQYVVASSGIFLVILPFLGLKLANKKSQNQGK